MLKSLRARNVALMAGMLFLGQILTMLLVGVFVLNPQAQRVATILARNVQMVGATLDALPKGERARFIDRVNANGTFQILPGHGEPPGVDGTPSWLETRVLRGLAIDLKQGDTMVWRGGGGAPLWVRMRLGKDDVFWVSLTPSPGWTPTGALLGAVTVGLILSLVAGLALQRRLNRPLSALADAVDAMPDTQPVGFLAREGPVEIARVAASFEQMAARLTAQEADRVFMLAGISHDLKTPIAKLRLAAALRDTGAADDNAMIARQFDRIERMLDQFLDFGRGSDAEAPLRTDLWAVLSDVTVAAGLEHSALSGEHGMFAIVRPIAFERTMANVIRNALTHGGPPVRVTLDRADNIAVVTVTDSGPGVEAAMLDQLYRPFLRGASARPSDGGVGLGLAIAKRFAAEHGGGITFENRLEGGFSTRLTFALNPG